MKRNLGWLITICLVFSLLAVLSLAIAFYLFSKSTYQQTYQRQAETSAQALVSQIEDKISFYQSLVNQVATLPDLSNIIQSDNESILEDKARLLEFYFPDALKVRIIPNGYNNTEEVSVPHLGYACLAMVDESTKNNFPPGPEFHMSGSPSAHVDMVGNIKAVNGLLVGHLLVSLKPTLFDNVFNQQSAQNKFAFRQYEKGGQKFSTIYPAANQTDAHSEDIYLSPVTKTSWKIAAWPAQSTIALPQHQKTLIYSCVGLGILLLLAGPIVTRIFLYKQVEHDTLLLGNMIDDIKRDKLETNYQFNLQEFKRIAKYLHDSGKQLIADHQALIQTAQTDKLTGLPTENIFHVRIDQLFNQTRLGFPSSVLLIDIDNMKFINDKYGHEAGNAVITHMAESLKKVTRKSDYVAALGDGKFGMVLSLADEDSAATGVEVIRNKIITEVELASNAVIKYKWSGGVSTMWPMDPGGSEVIHRCKTALTASKEAGGNQTQLQN